MKKTFYINVANIISYIFFLFFFVNCSSNNNKPTEKTQQNRESNVENKVNDWKVGSFNDEFGEDTGVNFIYLKSEGQFSNTASTNARAVAILQVFNKGVCFKLWDYGDYLLKEDCLLVARIKDSTGEIREFEMENHKDGSTSYTGDDEELFKILRKEGIMSIVFKRKWSSEPLLEYRFKFDLSGFNEKEKILYK